MVYKIIACRRATTKPKHIKFDSTTSSLVSLEEIHVRGESGADFFEDFIKCIEDVQDKSFIKKVFSISLCIGGKKIIDETRRN